MPLSRPGATRCSGTARPGPRPIRKPISRLPESLFRHPGFFPDAEPSGHRLPVFAKSAPSNRSVICASRASLTSTLWRAAHAMNALIVSSSPRSTASTAFAVVSAARWTLSTRLPDGFLYHLGHVSLTGRNVRVLVVHEVAQGPFERTRIHIHNCLINLQWGEMGRDMSASEQARSARQRRRHQQSSNPDQQNHGLRECRFCSLGRSTHHSRQAGPSLGTRLTGTTPMASDVPGDGDPAPVTDSSSTLRSPVPGLIGSDESTLATDPIEPRPYIEIRPSETTVDPAAVTRSMQQLGTACRPDPDRGARHDSWVGTGPARRVATRLRRASRPTTAVSRRHVPCSVDRGSGWSPPTVFPGHLRTARSHVAPLIRRGVPADRWSRDSGPLGLVADRRDARYDSPSVRRGGRISRRDEPDSRLANAAGAVCRPGNVGAAIELVVGPPPWASPAVGRASDRDTVRRGGPGRLPAGLSDSRRLEWAGEYVYLGYRERGRDWVGHHPGRSSIREPGRNGSNTRHRRRTASASRPSRSVIPSTRFVSLLAPSC